MTSSILGLGHYLPAEVERVGVRRPIAVEEVGPSTLAARASAPALQQAGLAADAVDFIVFATMTPDVTFPGAGCYLQHHLGCGTVGAVDVRAQCAGFLQGLLIADQFVRAGTYKHVLVAGAEVHSSGLDYSERGAAVSRLFGDGAGVAMIGNGSGPGGIRSVVMHCDGSRYDRFWCETPASRQHPLRMTVQNFRDGTHFPAIDFDAVRRFGLESLPAVAREALAGAKVTADQVDHFIISHIMPDVGEHAGSALQVPPSRLSIPSARHGHLSAAALPVTLSELVAGGQLGAGATVCLAASGAGFAWGAAVLTL